MVSKVAKFIPVRDAWRSGLGAEAGLVSVSWPSVRMGVTIEKSIVGRQWGELPIYNRNHSWGEHPILFEDFSSIMSRRKNAITPTYTAKRRRGSG
jgi:hypothetical protein